MDLHGVTALQDWRLQELSSCKALAEVDAAHNQLSALPSQLCALHNLRTLMLESNRYSVRLLPLAHLLLQL